MTIIEYRSVNDIDELFIDGVLVWHGCILIFSRIFKISNKDDYSLFFLANKKLIG